MDLPDIAGFDIAAPPPGFHQDPFPVYAALTENEPVKRLPDGSVLLSRWGDLDMVYRDTTRFLSDKKRMFAPKYGADSALFEHHTTSLVFNDPPLHTRVRKIMVGAMTPRALGGMEAGLIAQVDRLIDGLRAQAGSGEPVDLIEDFATAIPIEVIGNLFDIPPGEHARLVTGDLWGFGARIDGRTGSARQQGGDRIQRLSA